MCAGTDRSSRCFRCGEEGRLARECVVMEVKCALCALLGKPAGHRMGGGRCHPPQATRYARVWEKPTVPVNKNANASECGAASQEACASEVREEAAAIIPA